MVFVWPLVAAVKGFDSGQVCSLMAPNSPLTFVMIIEILSSIEDGFADGPRGFQVLVGQCTALRRLHEAACRIRSAANWGRVPSGLPGLLSSGCSIRRNKIGRIGAQ